MASEKRTKEIKNKPIPVTPKPASGSPTQYGFVPVKTASGYLQQEPKTHYLQQQLQYSVPEQYAGQRYTTIQERPQYYQYQPTVQAASKPPAAQYYYHQQPRRYENVQYVADNSIQPTTGQQYYMQYVYLHPAPSTAIQTVVDPKGGLQYIMYVPTYVPQQTQQYETAVDYEGVPPAAPQQYQVTEEKYQQGKEDQYATIKQIFVPKREPKSLLDSYVPSILQYQYYKQQQAQLNSLRDGDLKIAHSSNVEHIQKTPDATNYNSYKINTSYRV